MNPNRVRLNDPVSDFSRFVDDQVLTASQLNHLIDYLVDQQRATRANLLGSGILCGLNLGRQGNTVTLSAGVAISSDGDLLTQPDDEAYTQFRLFEDTEALYPAWRPSGQLLPMWELHTATSNIPGLLPLSEFNAQGGGFANVQVVLYLEHYLEDFKLCDANDCDNRGPREAFNLRVLLVQRTDSLRDLVLQNEYFNLPIIDIPRVSIRSPDINRYDTSNGLAERFVSEITNTRTQISAALAQAAGGMFASLIGELQGQGPSWTEQLSNENRFNPGNNARRVQYIYAFFRDLADAYHEWRECLLDLEEDCMPNPARYPRHILLGEVRQNPDAERRHRYHPGPVERRNDAMLEKAKQFLQRMHDMLRFFEIPEFTNTSAIRLTPSRLATCALGEKAIPFYYNPSDQRPLHLSWDPEKTKRRIQRSIPSYFSGNYNPGASAESSARSPWNFRHKGSDFIRIEGHIGQEVEVVQAQLQSLSRQHNVSFQVLAVQLEDEEARVRLPPVLRFPDLETFFHVYQFDIANNLRNASVYNQSIRDGLTSTNFDGNDTVAEAASANLIAGTLQTTLSAASLAMPRTLTQFREQTEAQASTFTSHLMSGISSAGSLSSATINLFRPSRETPVQRLADGVNVRQFGLIKELMDKRRKRVRERSIFARFAEENPGLEHLGGVQSGGTLVLVYAADDGEVLADFSLPYYSYFDMSTLEPEEIEPEPADPVAPTPVRPPYVLDIPNWGVINQSPVFTLQGFRIQSQVENVGAQIQGGLSNLLAGISISQGAAMAIPGTSTTPGSWPVLDGVFNVGVLSAASTVTDPDQKSVLNSVNRLRGELVQIQDRVDRNIGVASDQAKIDSIEQELAELVVIGSNLERLQGDDASLTVGDKAFIDNLGITAISIKEPGARATVAARLAEINTAQPNSSLGGVLGGLAAVVNR